MTQRQRGWLLPPAAVSLLAGVFIGRETDRAVWPLCAVFFALFAVLLLRGRLRFIACITVALSLGVFAGSLAFHPALPDEGEYTVSGVISDEVTTGSFGQYRLYLSDVSLNGFPYSGKAYWTFYSDVTLSELLPGKAVSFHASLYHPSGAVNPDGINFRESLLQRGVTVCLYGSDELLVHDADHFSFSGTVAAVRHRIAESFQNTLGDETGTYACALLLGMRSLIPSEDRQAFANLGIAHILSVSGFHVGILIGALAALFRLFRLRQGLRVILYAVVLFLYAVLCGMSQPVIRASLLLLLSVEGRLLNRPRSGLHLLCAVLVIMTLLSPVQVTSASFQLTFCAMFGLIWFAPPARRFSVLFRRRVPKTLAESLVLTFGVQLGLLFPELMFFQRLPLLVFLINLPATLVFSVLISSFWLVLLLLPFPGLALLLSGPLSVFTGSLLTVVRKLGSLPGLTLWIHAPDCFTAAGVVLVFLSCCLFLRFHRGLRFGLFAAGAALIVFSLLPVPHTSTEYIQFSAGNADAAVLRDADKTFVIDTGENDSVLSSYLRTHRLIPDAVFLTHLHSDHAGGLRSMMDDGIPVPLLYLPEGAESQQIHPDFALLLDELRASGTEIRTLCRGDVVPLPSGVLTVLWPEKGKIRPGQDANNYSLVSRLVLKGTAILLTGDLPESYDRYCTAPADLLKAAHHGSRSSTSESFLSAVSPSAILLSCRQEARVQSFRERIGDIPLFATAECGAVTVRFEEGGYTVVPFLSD
ncbi:MAG: ComEC/Rec2 family competence protein [Clostridia bacterium]|nr:ComEC/Rec2 family competence protein [Clostridia bacterium]